MFRISHSIRLKIAIIVFLSTVLTIVISWSISTHFIEQFYVTHTTNSLIKTYKSCNEFFMIEGNVRALEEEEIISLYGYVDNPVSASIYVIDPEDFRVFTSVKLNEKTAIGIQALIQSYDMSEFYNSETKYNIVKNKVQPSEANDYKGGSFYDLIGVLDNGFSIILRAPVESSNESSLFMARLFMRPKL